MSRIHRRDRRSVAGLCAWVPDGRRLIVIDIENLVGGSGATTDKVATTMARLRIVVRATSDDVCLTACGRALVGRAAGVLPGRLLLGRGVDGADRRLVEALEPGGVAGRYRSVVLASGDAPAFAEPVERLAAAGVPTDVVLGDGAIGHRLYSVARSVVFLADHRPKVPSAA